MHSFAREQTGGMNRLVCSGSRMLLRHSPGGENGQQRAARGILKVKVWDVSKRTRDFVWLFQARQSVGTLLLLRPGSPVHGFRVKSN